MNMASDTTGYSIVSGFIELKGGMLSINSIEIKDIIVSGYSLIKVNEGSGIVNIIGSKFENISRTESNGKGSVIEGYVDSSNGLITVSSSSSSTFNNCKVNSSDGLGGGIYLKISNGG